MNASGAAADAAGSEDLARRPLVAVDHNSAHAFAAVPADKTTSDGYDVRAMIALPYTGRRPRKCPAGPPRIIVYDATG